MSYDDIDALDYWDGAEAVEAAEMELGIHDVEPADGFADDDGSHIAVCDTCGRAVIPDDESTSGWAHEPDH